jgi:hypothetical protein
MFPSFCWTGEAGGKLKCDLKLSQTAGIISVGRGLFITAEKLLRTLVVYLQSTKLDFRAVARKLR